MTVNQDINSLNLKEKYINKIKECIDYLNRLDIDIVEVILFGSCARNKTHLGSDVDLLVLTRQKLDRITRGLAYADLCYPLNGVNADIVFSKYDDFYEEANVRLYDQIKKEGVILWQEKVITR
ncbi:MAG: polymerase beta, Nucleotidyltransferase [Lachnospiraceae bacterium]|jgi:predicted nucleotidyltransferase|nr:polymerase beta, Nucleotidyltransferase [Lachnospiraceae bacterium]